MSAWGVKLYQNDIAKDIKHMYKEYLRNGKTNEEATQELILKFEEVLEDIEDGANFWLALADQQWQLGKLMPYVKKQALNQIQNGADLRIWYETSTELGNERKKVLEELSIKLNSLQPPEKKISKRRFYKCPWKVGDVFAVEMNTAYAKEQGLYGKYIIFQKAAQKLRAVNDELDGNTSPIIRCWINETPHFTKMCKCIRWSKNLNNYGKYHYAYEIYTTSKRSVSKNLIYLGNYELIIPENDAGDIINCQKIVYWNNIEKIIINNYKKYI